MKYGLLGYNAAKVIKQTTARGNVNMGTQGALNDVVLRAAGDKAAITKYIIGGNEKDAAELLKRGVRLIVGSDAGTIGLIGLGCTHEYTSEGIDIIDIEKETKPKKTVVVNK
jgi:hypothetical protein